MKPKKNQVFVTVKKKSFPRLAALVPVLRGKLALRHVADVRKTASTAAAAAPRGRLEPRPPLRRRGRRRLRFGAVASAVAIVVAAVIVPVSSAIGVVVGVPL